jgi:hypothetical protein
MNKINAIKAIETNAKGIMKALQSLIPEGYECILSINQDEASYSVSIRKPDGIPAVDVAGTECEWVMKEAFNEPLPKL